MRNDLRSARTRVGLTQAKLAKLIGTDQGTVSRLENGSREVDKNIAPLLAKHLRLNVLDVLYPKEKAA